MNYNIILQWFNDYTSAYDKDIVSNPNPIRIKIDHSKIVAKIMLDIAKHSGLKGDNLVIAETTGLLHDIGRFEQYAKYKTFQDRKSANHAHIGVEVLKDESVLKYFSNSDARAILKAIEYHNAKEIKENLNEKEMMFAKMVRDADKADIYRIIIDYLKTRHIQSSEAVELSLSDSPEISDSVASELLKGKIADYTSLKTINDFKILLIGWVYDINFPRTFEIISEHKYINQLYALIPHTPVTTQIYHNAVKHIENKLSQYTII